MVSCCQSHLELLQQTTLYTERQPTYDIISSMNASHHPAPMNKILTLPFRPSKRPRSPSPSLSEEDGRLAKRLRKIKLDDIHVSADMVTSRPIIKHTQFPSSHVQDDSAPPKGLFEKLNILDSSPPSLSSTQQPETKRTALILFPFSFAFSSKIELHKLSYPAMLHPKCKRQGLPIHKQFITPNDFARHLDQQHPDIKFAVKDYHEAWHFAIELARKNLDFSFVRPVHGGEIEEEMGMVHRLVSFF